MPQHSAHPQKWGDTAPCSPLLPTPSHLAALGVFGTPCAPRSHPQKHFWGPAPLTRGWSWARHHWLPPSRASLSETSETSTKNIYLLPAHNLKTTGSGCKNLCTHTVPPPLSLCHCCCHWCARTPSATSELPGPSPCSTRTCQTLLPLPSVSPALSPSQPQGGTGTAAPHHNPVGTFSSTDSSVPAG